MADSTKHVAQRGWLDYQNLAKQCHHFDQKIVWPEAAEVQQDKILLPQFGFLLSKLDLLGRQTTDVEMQKIGTARDHLKA